MRAFEDREIYNNNDQSLGPLGSSVVTGQYITSVPTRRCIVLESAYFSEHRGSAEVFPRNGRTSGCRIVVVVIVETRARSATRTGATAHSLGIQPTSSKS